jgi:hypothetical protein
VSISSKVVEDNIVIPILPLNSPIMIVIISTVRAVNIGVERGSVNELKKETYSKSQMYSGSFKGAVLLERPMLLFSIDNDSL